ncbi:MAG: winged helix-turn-helix domain-containing protein [Candidatus Bathyarchaeota archaeon]|nr:winged helix-turn-helix domain-containing protein [Candidatus Bathyarchaeota archaeon]
MNYRSKLDIIADILRVAQNGAKRTQIMYQANLSYKILCKYVEEITAASLLYHDSEKQRYLLTEKGQEFLDAYKEYQKTTETVERSLCEVRDEKKALEKLCDSDQ